MIRERKLYLLTFVSIVAATKKSNVEVHEASNLSENGEGNRNDDVFMDTDTCVLDLKGDITGRIPAELFLEITIHYEETFLFASNGSHEAAQAEIQELLTQAQAYFYDASLQTKIHLKVVNITFWPGEYITATDHWIGHSRNLLRDHNFPEANSHVFLGYYNYWEEIGIETPDLHFDEVGYFGKGVFACTCSTDYRCLSIVEKPTPAWQNWRKSFLRFFLHELGHNLGMHHDSQQIWGQPRPDGMEENFCWRSPHGFDGELQIMTRSEDWTGDIPFIWSPCVRCDLLEYYYLNLHTNDMFCLATPTPTPAEGCAQVTCSFALDDVTEEVLYNDVKLTMRGQLDQWDSKKITTFQSCDNNNPGQLILRGSDNQDDDHCKRGGLVLHCTASDETSPWHNFKSDTEHWRVDNGDVPCERNIGPWSMRLPLFQKLNELGAKKIWAPKKEVTLIGSPL